MLYDTPALKPEELTRLFLEFSADFGVAAIATYDAVQDRKIERVEAMRLNKALMDIISTAQQLQQGLSPYV